MTELQVGGLCGWKSVLNIKTPLHLNLVWMNTSMNACCQASKVDLGCGGIIADDGPLAE